MPVKDNREYRKFTGMMEVRAAAPESDEKIVEGYATTFNEEYELFRDGNYIMMESVDSHAFDECDLSDVILQFDHEGRVFARISNGTLAVNPDDHGLFVRANLGGTEIGRQLYEEIKGGYVTKMSFGFHVSAQERTVEERTEDGITWEIIHRKITGINKLYDCSVVSLPANDATCISCRNVSDGLIREVQAERQAEEARRKQLKRISILLELNGGNEQ